MATRITLKNILSKKNDVPGLTLSLIEQMKAHVSITDEKGHLLYGNSEILTDHQIPIKIHDEIIGWVKGDEKSGIIGSLLMLLTQKENERRSLGNEVLMLYREVNMVFSFADKLAQTLGAEAIAQITVKEAMHLIKSVSGVVVLWDDINKQLQILSSEGSDLFNKANLVRNADLLLRIGLSGQSEIMADLSALKEAGVIDPEVQSIIYAALKVKHRIMGAVILASNFPNHYAAADLKFLTTLALQSSSAIESSLLYEKNLKEAREREESMRHIFEKTEKFVPYEFISSLGHKVITDVKLGDQVEKVVTVLFSDLRDYTTLSEQMTPEENFRFISSFNEEMGPIIRQNKGFINQYLGDAIMALFTENPEQALTAAIEMNQKIREFNNLRKAKNLPLIKMGLGMHTGPLIMGITGDKDRMDATTISDTVNTASRIENLTKYYHTVILLSETSLNQIEDRERFYLRYLGKVQVKGKQSSTGIYECFNSDNEDQISRKMRSLSLFNEGMHNYLYKSFDKAIKAFQSVIDENPEDRTVRFFLENANRFYHKGVPENWSGVLEMASK
jgi:adenylate cyclase